MQAVPNKSLLAFALQAGLVLCINFGCSSATPPPPPSPLIQAQERDAGTTKVGGTGGDTSTDTGSEIGSNSAGSSSDATDTGSAGGTGSGTGTVPAASNSTNVGAAIGSDTDKAAVTACLANHTFYDRFANSGAGACTTYALAPMSCTNAGIVAILTPAQLVTYQANVTGTGPFAGWLIDQCVDCPPSNTIPACVKKSGFVESGTKVFYVQEGNTGTGTELSIQSLCLPVRPGQPALPAGSCGS